MVEEPFSKVIIDCVGPLPKTKKGNQFLLTVMCSTTRYPEVFPLSRIMTKSIAPQLIKFFTQFGIPKVVQSDQGTNFTSGLFQQVMDALGITQYLSTAYHPESQGALKCFHQTLKSMLTKFCMENEKDWDQAIPFVMYAVRSARQDSLGFSPFELLFGRDVRGPLKLLQESWLDEEESITLAEYVVNMKETLDKVRSLAHSNLLSSQEKMKDFDVKSVKREFQPGELVLLFLPVRKSPFQTSYQGPHKVVAKENCLNYIIETPGHRKQKRKVHIILLKKYHPRDCDNADSNISSKVCCTKVEEVSNGCDFDPQVEEVRLKNSDILRCPSTKFSHLSQNQMTHIHQLLEEFAKLFSDVPLICPLVKHDVQLVDGAAPVKQAPYRLPPRKLEIM